MKRLSSPRPSSSAVAAGAVGVLALALGLAALVYAWANRDLPVEEALRDSPRWFGVQNAFSTLAFLVPGWYIAVKAPGSPFGWLLLLGAVGHGIAGAGWGYVIASEVGTGGYPAPWLGFVLGMPGAGVEVPILAAVMTYYPDGKRPAGWVGWVGVACILLGIAGTATAALDPLTGVATDPESSLGRLRNPIGTGFFHSFDQGGLLFMAPAGVGPVVVVVARWLRASGELKRLLGWLVMGTFGGALLAPIALLGSDWAMLSVQVPTILVLAALVAASLRHRVYGIEVVVSRAFALTALLAVVALVYGAIIGAATVLAGSATPAASFIAAVAAAFALAPARGRVERLVNRVLFGFRDEPYRVLSEVASQLESAGAGDQLLPGFTSQVALALRVPYVAVEYGEHPDVRTVSSGERGGAAERFPLLRQGVEIGSLTVGLRSGERAFSAADRGLLENLARQASVAVANVVLTQDLQHSRGRIVSAREEERRRLRRDLHDGLGPVLAGAAMMVDAGRNLMRADVDEADRQLLEARAQVSAAIEDVRRLVYGLRPPALDELGLVGALHEQARRSPVEVTIQAEGAMSELPAAVEVAAYRIISEAMNNAARHASATVCRVGISLNGALVIDVSDNGTSSGPWRAGVGIIAMRERAAELGGICEVGPGFDGGGRVRAVLPVDGGS